MARCPFEAIVGPQIRIVHRRPDGSVGILAKDSRGLASRLVSVSLQGMHACIVNDPAIQGCHEAWLLGYQGHPLLKPIRVFTSDETGLSMGRPRCRMVWS